MMSEREMLDLLHARYSQVNPGNGPRWVCAEHVRNAPGFAATRTLDFVALDTWGNLELHGHEIKCSRSDWLRELKDPEKAMAFTSIVDRFWLVVSDRSIVNIDELPEGWGLMVKSGSRLRASVQAPKLSATDIPRRRLVPLMRATQATARRRQHSEDKANQLAVMVAHNDLALAALTEPGDR